MGGSVETRGESVLGVAQLRLGENQFWGWLS